MILTRKFLPFFAIIMMLRESSANQICKEHRKRFNIFQLVEIHEALSQWNSVLPFILLNESDDVMKNNGYCHGEFNYLGPIGPKCAKEWVSYGTGDEEKRVCGEFQLYHHQHKAALDAGRPRETKKVCCL